MMKKIVDDYAMERAIPRSSRDFGTIEHGQERHYMYMTDTIESNLLKQLDI